MRKAKLYYGIIKREGAEPEARVYFVNDVRWFEDTLEHNARVIKLLPLMVRGYDYAARQNDLRELAIKWQSLDSEYSGGSLSMMEYSILQDWFAEQGERYGLLREFRENGIC